MKPQQNEVEKCQIIERGRERSHLVIMPSTQTMEPINPDKSSLGVTLRETKGPSSPTRICSPSFKYLPFMLLTMSVTASQSGCIYSLGVCKSLQFQQKYHQEFNEFIPKKYITKCFPRSIIKYNLLIISRTFEPNQCLLCGGRNGKD